jgi:hypothetical protein
MLFIGRTLCQRVFRGVTKQPRWRGATPNAVREHQPRPAMDVEVPSADTTRFIAAGDMRDACCDARLKMDSSAFSSGAKKNRYSRLSNAKRRALRGHTSWHPTLAFRGNSNTFACFVPRRSRRNRTTDRTQVPRTSVPLRPVLFYTLARIQTLQTLRR